MMAAMDQSSDRIPIVLRPGSSLLFAYGTMMRGNRNQARLALSPTLGRASTLYQRFALYCVGYAPMAVEDRENGRTLWGECYAVRHSTLMRLDRAEGHPWKYKRKRIDIRLVDGRIVKAWAYLVPRAVLALEEGKTPVPSGKWKQPTVKHTLDNTTGMG